jgi:Ser-tRNA(Ala) deacylase AlaX
MKIFSVLFFTILLFSFPLFSEDSKSSINAREILDLNNDAALEKINRLSKEEANVLISQIRAEARKEYKDIDKFYLLISHLESIKAIEEEEKKLKDLNLVYILGLFLVVFVIGYTLFSQRKTLETIKRLSSK